MSMRRCTLNSFTTREITPLRKDFGRSRQGLDFDALDNQPVTLVMLFLVPQGQFQKHLRTLADISDEAAGKAAAALGFSHATSDWRAMVADPEGLTALLETLA